MKIALIVPGGVDRSGDVRVIPALLALIRRLAKEHEIHVFALHQEPLPGSWSLNGARIHNAGEKFDLWRTFLAILAEHRAGRFEIIQSIWSGKCGFVCVICARLLGIPGLIHVAGGELTSLPEISYGGRRHWQGRLREAIVLRLAHAVTAASAPMIEKLTELGIEAQRVPLGVDIEDWPPCPPRHRAADEPIRLIHVGSLNPVKDQATLLRALSIVAGLGQDFRCNIVGEDTLNGRIQSLSTELGLENRVSFHGFLRHRDLYPLMLESDILLISSLHEAGPVVALEAAALGVPTVGTTVGHLQEWASEAAIAVPVGDAESLARAIVTLCSDELLRLELAQRASEIALAEDAGTSAQRFVTMYSQIRGTQQERAS